MALWSSGRHGADIGRQTLNCRTHATARHLSPIDQAIRAELIQAAALEIDETSVDYQSPRRGSVSEGRLWAYRDPVGSTCTSTATPGAERPACWTCSAMTGRPTPSPFKAPSTATATSFYDTVAAKHGLRHGGSLARIRRRFTDLGNASTRTQPFPCSC